MKKALNYLTEDLIHLIKENHDLDIHSLERVNINSEKIYYVYFLFDKDELVYIGKTINIHQRVYQHKSTKTFDSYSFIESNFDDYEFLERIYINIHKPKYNIDLITEKIKNI